MYFGKYVVDTIETVIAVGRRMCLIFGEKNRKTWILQGKIGKLDYENEKIRANFKFKHESDFNLKLRLQYRTFFLLFYPIILMG